MIPEALARERGLRKAPKPAQNCLLVPVSYREFAAMVNSPVDESKHHVVPNTWTLVALWHSRIDEVEQPKALGNTKQGGNATELGENRFLRSRRLGFLSSLDDTLNGTKILLPRDPGLTVNSFGFDGVIVLSAFLGLADNCGHGVYSSI
jgi:hypothetical protein